MPETLLTLRPRRHGGYAGFPLASLRLAVSVLVFAFLLWRQWVEHSSGNLALIVMVFGFCVFAFWAWWQAGRRCTAMEVSRKARLRCHTPMGASVIDPREIEWVKVYHDGLVIRHGNRFHSLKDVGAGIDPFVAALVAQHPELKVSDRRD